jgi:hypothetical protein
MNQSYLQAYDAAVSAFREMPSATNWEAMERAMLAYQDAWQADVERRDAESRTGWVVLRTDGLSDRSEVMVFATYRDADRWREMCGTPGEVREVRVGSRFTFRLSQGLVTSLMLADRRYRLLADKARALAVGGVWLAAG